MKIAVEYSSNDSQTQDYVAPTVSKNTKQKILISSVMLGFSAGIPYASPAYRAGGGSAVLGSVYVGATCLSFGCATTWGWNHLLNEFTHKYITGEFNSKAALLHAVGACFGASFSCGMDFAIAQRYNHNLILPTMAFVHWYGIDATGYYKIISYLTNTAPVLATRAESEWEKIIKNAIMIFPVGNLMVNAVVSFKSGREFVENDLYALPFSLLALSTFALDVFSAYELVDQIFAPENQEDSEAQYARVYQLLFKVLAYTIIACATSSDYFIASDTFNHSLAGDALGIAAVVSGVILGKYLLDDLSRELFFHKKPVSRLLINDEETPLLREEKSFTTASYN